MIIALIYIAITPCNSQTDQLVVQKSRKLVRLLEMTRTCRGAPAVYPTAEK